MVANGRDLQAAKEELFSEVRQNFQAFLKARSADAPFCYWYGPTNVHRTWIKGSGKKLWGFDPDALKGKLPAYLPDVAEVREDLVDYFGEIAAWDACIGVLIDELEKQGLRDNTLIAISGDHGAPGFPHGKCNLYGFGTGVSLAISGPGVEGGRVVDDFVCLPDLAPTFPRSWWFTRTRRHDRQEFCGLSSKATARTSGSRRERLLSPVANATLRMPEPTTRPIRNALCATKITY